MKKVLVVCMVGALCLAATGASAFDGSRKGFQIAGGIGLGMATVEDADSEIGVATTFRIGGGITDQLSLNYCNRAVFYKMDGLDDLLAHGVTAVALTYYMNPEGPSLYGNVEVGLGWAQNISESVSAEDPGLGFSIGIGYEFATHYSVEATYTKGTVEEDIDISIISLTLAATAF